MGFKQNLSTYSQNDQFSCYNYMNGNNLASLSNILVALNYTINSLGPSIGFNKIDKLFLYHGLFDLETYILEIKVNSIPTYINCTKDFLFNLARDEERIINSRFIARLIS